MYVKVFHKGLQVLKAWKGIRVYPVSTSARACEYGGNIISLKSSMDQRTQCFKSEILVLAASRTPFGISH